MFRKLLIHTTRYQSWLTETVTRTINMAEVVNVNSSDILCLATKAARSLKNGNIIAVPTDTIYGVAGLAQKNEAIQKLYSIKARETSKAIAISVADIEDVYKWGHVTISRPLLMELLPGPVTVIFERTCDLSLKLNPGTSLIGIRIPDNDFMRAIARVCQEPIALTSANISKATSTVSVEEFRDLWPFLDIVFDGGILGNTQQSRLGSTVVDLSVKGYYTIIRDGSALTPTVEKLEKYGLMQKEKVTTSNTKLNPESSEAVTENNMNACDRAGDSMDKSDSLCLNEVTHSGDNEGNAGRS